MKIKRTSNIQHSTPNIERGIQTAANSFGVQCSMPARDTDLVACSRKRSFSELDVECSMLNVECSRSQPSTLNPQPSRCGLQPSAFSLQPSQNGVALVITLILLSVVTFMAITFLALSRRERSAVATVTDTASARLAADAALANAEAQVIANVLATTNPYNFTLLVSTNYINPIGFQTAPPVLYTSLTNVNYQYPNGNPLNAADFRQNLINLYYSPRPPVFIPTNAAGSNDFRFYLDLNRNGRFETNGWVAELDNSGAVIRDGLGSAVTNIRVGDPEWIGVLERPDVPYGPNNKFIARYAFIAVPVGNALDLNAIHNQTFDPIANRVLNPPVAGDVFFRNQGVGSWEINLAAFLADLNTNVWLPTLPPNNTYYGYYQPAASPNRGRAFEDARALLAWRYANNYISLANVSALYGAPGQAAFRNNIDGYSDGPLMITLSGTNDYFQDVTLPWAGADNTNHFFTHQELFDPTKTQTGVISPTLGFSDHLMQAGTNVSTYDRYTYYRLLSQLGTDSAPDSGKMNLNYDNLTTNSIPGGTNFIAWTPLGFFTNAADRLLRAYTIQWRNSNPTNFAATFYSVTDFTNIIASQWTTNYLPFGIGNIPVWVNNRFVYSSAVNRVLQLAANIYDATTNNTFALGNNYPSVFRPLFSRDSAGNVFVTGYAYVESVSGKDDLVAFSTPFDASTISALSTTTTNVLENVYGVPWIIGAKKGFPNFNKFTMQDVVQITRKLQIRRSRIPITSVSDFLYTNQMYIFSISNSIGINFWNSYGNGYPNPVQIVVRDNLSMMLTNDGMAPFVVTYPLPYSNNTNLPVTPSWPGSAWNTAIYKSLPAANSFIIPINTTVQFLTNSVFYTGTMPPGVKGFYPEGANLGWETNKHDFKFPNFGLLTTNRLQMFILDGNHVIDYVQFAGPDSSRNLNAEFQTNSPVTGFYGVWSTNLNADGVPWGIVNQIDVSEGKDAGNRSLFWADSQASDEASGFNDFMGYGTANGSSTAQSYKTNYIVQVPYTPTVTAYEYISWQANDPLVHYLASDLNFQGTESGGPTTGINVSTRISPLPRPSFNQVNDRYQPWGRNSQMAVTANVDPNPANLAFKDPLVRSSDNWDFPTNKFPTAGWLGRVHRGTPWQTVYLKASDVLTESNIGTNTWAQWTGDTQTNFNQYFDAINSAPVRDRLLFDLFTTAFNDNATRGTLSVNQGAGSSDPSSSLAAWSALFSGIVALSNNAPDSIRPKYQNPPPSNSVVIIQPAGVYNPALPLAQQPALAQIVQGISQTRTNTNLFPLQTFTHVGDILSVPQLTEQSPFLNLSTFNQITNGISDEMYEWLPQQTLSLLRVGGSPRYVIYCYGQALKPAPNSIYTGGGQFFGMVTNYQVVSEIATRAVVRFGSTVTNVVTSTNILGNIYWFTAPVVTNNNAVIENFNILPPD
jgi:hypothetical protein